MTSSETSNKAVTKNSTSMKKAISHSRRFDRISRKMVDEAENMQAKELEAVIKAVVYEMVDEAENMQAKELEAVIKAVVYEMVDEVAQTQTYSIFQVPAAKASSDRNVREFHKVVRGDDYSLVESVCNLAGDMPPGLGFINNSFRFGSLDYDPLLEGVVEAGWTERGISHWSLPGHPPRLFEGHFQSTSNSGRSVKSAKTPRLLLPAGEVLDGTPIQLSRILSWPAQAEMVSLVANELRTSTTAGSSEGNVASAANLDKLTNDNLPNTLNPTQFSATHSLVNKTHPGKNSTTVVTMVSGFETHSHEVVAMESNMNEGEDGGDLGVGRAGHGGSLGEDRGNGNNGGLNIVAANFTLDDTLDDSHGGNDDADNFSTPTASLALDDDLEEMLPTINSTNHAALFSPPPCSSSCSSMSVSTLPDMNATLQSQNASHQSRSVHSSDTPSDLSDNDEAGPDVAMHGMRAKNVSDAKIRHHTSSHDGSHQHRGLTYDRAEIDKDEFELSENEEHIKAIVRNNRYDRGDRGRASKWWWKALKDSRAETNAYAARKQEYKEALIIQCEYAERLEGENAKLGKLQKENAARITALEQDLKKSRRARK